MENRGRRRSVVDRGPAEFYHHEARADGVLREPLAEGSFGWLPSHLNFSQPRAVLSNLMKMDVRLLNEKPALYRIQSAVQAGPADKMN
jgi:hypothetical protein